MANTFNSKKLPYFFFFIFNLWLGTTFLVAKAEGDKDPVSAKRQTSENQLFPSITAAANNECSGATPLTFNVKLNDNNQGATQSQPPNACNFFTPASANDVWYTFNYTSEMDCVVVVPNGNPASDIIIELFSGSCGNLTPIGCSNFAENNSSNQTEGINLADLGLTVGTSYKLRVYGYNGIEAIYYVHLKASTGIPPPGNDNCAQATTLVSGNFSIGTTAGATQSLNPVTCGSSTSSNARDVWYRFTKTSGMDSVIALSFSNSNLVLEVRSNNCTAGTSLGCSDQPGTASEKISIAGLANGTVYLVRVYGFNGAGGEFGIRIKSAPINNNCVGAREILESSGALISGTVDASRSLPPSSCLGNSDDDVWFQFVMTPTLDSVVVAPIGSFNPVIEVRSGTCTNSTAVACSNSASTTATEKIFIGNLTEGEVYFVRIYSFGGGVAAEGSFSIQLKKATLPPPANDNCTTPITIGASLTNGTNVSATQTAPGFSCGGGVSPVVNDVWYRFTKTEVMDTIKVDGLGALDLVLDIRNNTCPSGAVQICSNIPGNGVKKLPIGVLTNGNQYLLRVYGWEGATGDFTIEFLDSTFVADPPPNDDCFDAQSLVVGSSCSGTTGTNLGATESNPAASCSGPSPGEAKDVWYSFTATNARSIVSVTAGVGMNAAIQVFSGTCFGLTPLACADNFPASNNPDSPTTEDLVLQGLLVGQQYFVRVYGTNSTQGEFTICVYNPNCTSAAAELTTSQASVVSNQAFSVTVTGGTDLVNYQYSFNQTNWFNVPAVYGTVDTLMFSSTVSGPLYLRVSNRTGECYPTNSTIVNMSIRCATPFLNADTSHRINRVTLGTINQASKTNPMGGNVQDFSQISASVCRGNSYPLAITVNRPSSFYNRMAWVDFNQDGDFSDAGENVLFGAYTGGATVTNSISIPANAPLGSSRMRIAIVDNNNTLLSADPCAAGPYRFGEIEEYTLNITSGLLANAGTNQSVCGSTATLSGNDPGTGSTGLWTVVSGTGNFANPANFSTAVSGLSSGNNVFRWTITTACGNSQSEVTITSANATANAGTDQNLCTPNGTLNAVAPTAGSGQWTVLSGGATITSPTLRNSAVAGLSTGANAFIWTVTPSAPGCPPARDTVILTRVAEPSAALAGNDQSFCGTSATLAGNNPAIGTGTWSVVNGTGVFVNPTSATTVVNGLSAGVNTLRWTISNGSCAPKTDDVVLTVTSPPTAIAGADQEVCGTTVSLNGNAAGTGVTGTWSLLSGTATITQPSLNTTGVTGLGTGNNRFIWTLSRPGCPDGKDTVSIVRKTPPVSNAGVNQAVCANTATLNANLPTSGTGAWTVVSGSGTFSNANLAGSAVSNLGYGSNTFRWTVTDAPCAPATSEVTITNNLPGRPVAGADQTVCNGNGNLLATNLPQGLTGEWTLLSGSGNISAPGNSSTTVSGLGEGVNRFVYSISVSACSTSVSDTVAFTREVNPVDLGKDTTVCSNITPTYTLAGPPSMSQYSWSSGASTPQLVVNTASQYILTVVTPAGCSFRDTVVVQFQICNSVSALMADAKASLKVIPNPSDGEAGVLYSLSRGGDVQISVFDMKGKKVFTQEGRSAAGDNEIRLPDGLSPGMYQVHVLSPEFTKTLTWVVGK